MDAEFCSVLKEYNYSFESFAPASSSEFKEAGFLGARQQRSEFKAVALFSFEGILVIPSMV
ncbi:hypothetical protein IC801_12510 [Geobacillus sp. 44B]|nr:hypothetical protein IC801_12510 [Geobacillus sp. 44B]